MIPYAAIAVLPLVFAISDPSPEASASLVKGAEATSSTPPELQRVLELSYAISFFRGRDALASPVAYQGFVAGGSLSYERRGQNSWHWLYLDGGRGRPKPLFASGADDNRQFLGESLLIDASLRYGYHHLLVRSQTERFGLYAGGVADADFLFFRPNSRTDAYFRLITWSLNAGVLASYRAANHRHLVVGQLFTPFLTQLGRSPWTLREPKLKPSILYKGDLTSLNGYRAVTARFHYEYALSPRWNATASCEVSYKNSPHPEPINILSGSLFFGLSLSI